MWNALSTRLRSRTRRTMRREREAAVLVPIIDDGGPLRLLLTRRTENLSTHKGQVAFPGGRIDPGDSDAIAAALRETHEEVGLHPSRVQVVGQLDDLPTITGTTVVTPVLGRVVHVPPLTPEPGEVARIFDIPLAHLREASSWTIQWKAFEGEQWPVYFCEYDGEMLWGLSAYIVMCMLHLLPGGAPVQLPPGFR